MLICGRTRSSETRALTNQNNQPKQKMSENATNPGNGEDRDNSFEDLIDRLRQKHSVGGITRATRVALYERVTSDGEELPASFEDFLDRLQDVQAEGNLTPEFRGHLETLASEEEETEARTTGGQSGNWLASNWGWLVGIATVIIIAFIIIAVVKPAEDSDGELAEELKRVKAELAMAKKVEEEKPEDKKEPAGPPNPGQQTPEDETKTQPAGPPPPVIPVAKNQEQESETTPEDETDPKSESETKGDTTVTSTAKEEELEERLTEMEDKFEEAAKLLELALKNKETVTTVPTSTSTSNPPSATPSTTQESVEPRPKLGMYKFEGGQQPHRLDEKDVVSRMDNIRKAGGKIGYHFHNWAVLDPNGKTQTVWCLTQEGQIDRPAREHGRDFVLLHVANEADKAFLPILASRIEEGTIEKPKGMPADYVLGFLVGAGREGQTCYGYGPPHCVGLDKKLVYGKKPYLP